MPDTKKENVLIEELRNARRSAGWSRKGFAAHTGVDVQAIRRLESGAGSVATLIAATTALDFELVGIAPGHSLAEQLGNRRRKLSLSVDQLAERASLSRAAIVSLESGGGSVRNLVRLLSVVAPYARRRAPERTYWGKGDKADRDSRFTPNEFMMQIYAAFGEVDLDPCAHPLSPVVARRRIPPNEGGDGLTEDWSGRLAFVNPPYSELLTWLRRAHAQWHAGNVETVVCLIPVRTDSAWFHDPECGGGHLPAAGARAVPRLLGKGSADAVLPHDFDAGCHQ